MAERHIVVLGAEAVGKTALISKVRPRNCFEKLNQGPPQYLFKALPQQHEPTIEDHFRGCVRVAENTVLLDVIDTAGQEEYAMLHEPYLAVADGLFVVFSMVEKSSLERALSIIETNSERYSAPCVLVGNKADLARGERIISAGMTERYAGRYYETSAVTGVNVNEAWEGLIRQVLAKHSGRTDTTGRGSTVVKMRSPTIVVVPRAEDAKREQLDDSSDEKPRAECLPAREVCNIC